MVKHAPQLRDGRTPGWFYLDDALIDTHGQVVGAIGIAVYAALARHAKANGRAVVSYDQMAESLDLSRNTVIRKLHLLAESGLIIISPQTDVAGNPIAANVYTLCVIPEQKRERVKRGVPTDAPPHATSEPPVPTDERGVPTDAYIGHDPSLDKHDPPPPTPPTPPKSGGGGEYDRDIANLFRDYHIGQYRKLAKLYRADYPNVTIDQLRLACESRFDRTIPATLAGGRLYLALQDGLPADMPRTAAGSSIPEPTRVPMPADVLPPQEAAARILKLKAERDKQKREAAHASS